MKKSDVTALLTRSCLIGLGISCRAQSADRIVTVPFESMAGGATLRPGEHRISRINPGANDGLAIGGHNSGGRFSFPWLSMEFLPISRCSASSMLAVSAV